MSDKRDPTAMNARTIDRLCDKSQEAFILAVELYNRPTIRYRVEGCAFFLCNAWELLLKAYITKKDGEKSIYYPGKPSRTLSLEDCAKKIFTNENDPLRRNLDRVIDLRNTGTHFIVDEYEGIYAPILQACVENYDAKARELMGIEISDRIPENYLVLSVRRSTIDMDECRARYSSEVLNKMITARSEVLSGADTDGNRRYACTYVTDLRITKKKDADMTVRIDKSAEASVSLVTRLIDPKDKYPYRTKAVVALVNEKLSRSNVKIMVGGETKQSFTANDFQLFIKLYDMKSDSRYSVNTAMPGEQPWYSYSQQAIDDIFSVLSRDPVNALDQIKMRVSKMNGGASDD